MFVCLFALVITKQSKAQLTDLTPSQLKGAVLIDYDDYLSCDEWELIVEKRIYDEEGNFTEDVIYEQSVAGVDYFILPDEIMNDSSFLSLTVNTYDGEGNMLGSDEIEQFGNIPFLPPGGSQYHADYFEWICNGYQYSYAIRANMKLHNGQVGTDGYLNIDPYMNYSDPKMYIYYPLSDWENMVNSNPQICIDRHALSSTNYSLLYGNSNLVKLFYADASDGLRDWNGQIITTANHSALVGVRKERGPWRTHGYLTDDFSPIEGPPAWDIIEAKDNFNQFVSPDWNWYSPPVQELDCIGEGTYDPLVDTDAGDLAVSDELIIIGPGSPPTPPDNPFSDVDDIYDIINTIDSIINGSYSSTFSWPSIVTDIGLYKINDGGEEIDVFFRDSIYDNNGNLLLPAITLEAGIYSLNLNFDDRSHKYFVIEVYESVYNAVDISSFYNISAYPVPIEDNSFNLQVNSNITDDIIYRIFDNNGELYHEQRIHHDARENSTNNFYIEPKQDLPEGILINECTFSDGSTLSFQTIK